MTEGSTTGDGGATVTNIADPEGVVTEFHPSNAVKYVLVGAACLLVGAVVGVALAQIFDGSENEPKKKPKQGPSPSVTDEVIDDLKKVADMMKDPIAAMSDKLPGEGIEGATEQPLDPASTLPDGVLVDGPSSDTPGDLGI